MRNTSAALPAAARALHAMRVQPSQGAINNCSEVTNMSDALKDNNRRTFDSLLEGNAASLRGLRVLLLSDSTDYNALAYTGEQRVEQALHAACARSERKVFSFIFSPMLQTATCAAASPRTPACALVKALCMRMSSSRVAVTIDMTPPDTCSQGSPAYASASDRCDYGRLASLHFPRANFTWTV